MTARTVGVFGAIGELLEYPGAGYPGAVERCIGCLGDMPEEASTLIRRFVEAIEGMSVQALQERFTETFDLNPVCSLEVGWQLYGEEYARGNFLVAMRQLLRDHGIPESGELPDHLTHVLSLLDELEPDARWEFVTRYLSPALAKMTASFEGKDSPWRHVVQALGALLTTVEAPVQTEAAHG